MNNVTLIENVLFDYDRKSRLTCYRARERDSWALVWVNKTLLCPSASCANSQMQIVLVLRQIRRESKHWKCEAASIKERPIHPCLLVALLSLRSRRLCVGPTPDYQARVGWFDDPRWKLTNTPPSSLSASVGSSTFTDASLQRLIV